MRREVGGPQVPDPCALHKGQVPHAEWIGPRQKRLPSAAALASIGSRRLPAPWLILNVCREASELCWLKTKTKTKMGAERGKKRKKANTNLKSWKKLQRAQGYTGKGPGQWEMVWTKKSIQRTFILQMTGSLESLPSFTAAPAQRGQNKGKGKGGPWRWDMQGWRQ